MDLEHLTKHQIVLLTLLVSFVTSIATGIVTVSLMSQAPASVTRTINQIVERTVQTVVPQNQSAAVATEKTVVVKDDDLAAQSIAKVQKSIIRITVRGGDELVARGIIVDKAGTALTDRDALLLTEVRAFDAILSDGTRVPLSIRPVGATTTSIMTVDVAVGTSTGFAPVQLADVSKMRLGQSVIRIGGKGIDVVGVGVVAMLPTASNNGIHNTIQATVQSATPGSVLVTLFGDVVGIATTDSLAQGADQYSVAMPPAEKALKPAPKP